MKQAIAAAWLWVACLGWGSLAAQSAVDRAIWLWDTGSRTDAVNTIQRAAQGEAKQDAEAWYVWGYFEKELYKSEGKYPNSVHRESARNALSEAWRLPADAEVREQTRAALSYLSDTYFQDAMKWVAGFSLAAEPDAQAAFDAAMDLKTLIDPSLDKGAFEAEWERQLGQAFGRLLANSEAATEQELLLGAVGHYEASLVHEPEHYGTLYNLAITLYNHGVRQLKRIGPETSMFELMEIQDACVGLFEEALPMMQRAHDQQPDRPETLKGLMTIHHALGQNELSNRYKADLEKVLRSGGR